MTKFTLTNRELQVFRLLITGCSTKEVASELGLALRTVVTDRKHIEKKISVSPGASSVRRKVMTA
jgi:DNA-binding CsgD family transcriptional regulator